MAERRSTQKGEDRKMRMGLRSVGALFFGAILGAIALGFLLRHFGRG